MALFASVQVVNGKHKFFYIELLPDLVITNCYFLVALYQEQLLVYAMH